MDSSPPSNLDFNEFGLHADILKAIAQTGYTQPTPIQVKSIPWILQGRDIMGAAQTGTGKTAAFTLPMMQRLMPFASRSTSPAKHPVRALILTPTRELADQVSENVKTYCQFTSLRSMVVFGGVDIRTQKDGLRQGCEILIATPGRLLDHLEQRHVSLAQVGILVLDEADRMLDMGFMPDLERILKYLPRNRQSLLFSATFSPEIRQLAYQFLQNPVEINVAPKNSASDHVKQVVYRVAATDKAAAVHYLLASKGLSQVIVFVNTKIGVSRLTRRLQKEGIQVESIHGDRTQGERIRALEGFKKGEISVLVATDVAARGLDVAGLPCVINADLPFNAEDYVHRIGRTGRAGSQGEAISLVCEDEEKLLKEIELLIKTHLPISNLSIPDVFLHRGRSSSQAMPIDDFYYRPYEPKVQGQVNAQWEKQNKAQEAFEQKRQSSQMKAVLLGGP